MAYEALNQLVMEYGEFLEREDYSEIAVSAVFSSDAQVSFAVGGTGKGLAEIAKKHEEMMASFVGATHNITNVVVTQDNETSASIRFHMEVIHQFRPEIAKNTPGDLFIVNDRITAQAVQEAGTWKFSQLEMKTLYKRMVNSVE